MGKEILGRSERRGRGESKWEKQRREFYKERRVSVEWMRWHREEGEEREWEVEVGETKKGVLWGEGSFGGVVEVA